MAQKKHKSSWRAERPWPVLPPGANCPKDGHVLTLGSCNGCGLYKGLGYFIWVRCGSTRRDAAYQEWVKTLKPPETNQLSMF